MEEKEKYWDHLLKIRTTGRDDSKSDQYHFPYEPTPYPVLERLANSGYIRKKNYLIDYGCGKGRVDFYLSYQVRCKSLGIEYDNRIFKTIMENQKTAVSSDRTSFKNCGAENYEVGKEADRFYFFNPFSVEVFQKVLKKIEEAYYENPRKMLLFFYYPSDEYVACLMRQEELFFLDEIECKDLFPGNDPRERILVFELTATL